MTHGKNICKQLKEVRKRIAVENDIPLEIEECTYKGECRGTCPRCEAEARYLENALAEKMRIGKVATVAGLALGLAATAQAQVPQAAAVAEVPPIVKEVVHVVDSVTIKGTVVDSKTDEPIPFVNVIIADTNGTVTGTATDFDGNFAVKVAKGNYTITFSALGYAKYVMLEDTYQKSCTLPPVKLDGTVTLMGDIEVMEFDPYRHPVLEIDPYGSSQYLEVEGVKVIVR